MSETRERYRLEDAGGCFFVFDNKVGGNVFGCNHRRAPEKIVDKFNECDRLTAERDEWKQRAEAAEQKAERLLGVCDTCVGDASRMVNRPYAQGFEDAASRIKESVANYCPKRDTIAPAEQHQPINLPLDKEASELLERVLEHEAEDPQTEQPRESVDAKTYVVHATQALLPAEPPGSGEGTKRDGDPRIASLTSGIRDLLKQVNIDVRDEYLLVAVNDAKETIQRLAAEVEELRNPKRQSVADAMVSLGVESKSMARRLVAQGAVTVNGELVMDATADIKPGQTIAFRKFVEIVQPPAPTAETGEQAKWVPQLAYHWGAYDLVFDPNKGLGASKEQAEAAAAKVNADDSENQRLKAKVERKEKEISQLTEQVSGLLDTASTYKAKAEVSPPVSWEEEFDKAELKAKRMVRVSKKELIEAAREMMAERPVPELSAATIFREAKNRFGPVTDIRLITDTWTDGERWDSTYTISVRNRRGKKTRTFTSTNLAGLYKEITGKIWNTQEGGEDAK